MKKGNQQRSKKSFKLKLYIAGQSESSLRAKANLEAICEEFLKSSYELEIIDILEDPRRSLDDGVIVTPTLLKLSPPPKVKVIGDLSDTESLQIALGLERVPRASSELAV
jgi:circadian clock protein KaiB